jgi:hypothetical protein
MIMYYEGPLKLRHDEYGYRHYIDDPVKGEIDIHCGETIKVLFDGGYIIGRYESRLSEDDCCAKLYDSSGKYIIIPEGATIIMD